MNWREKIEAQIAKMKRIYRMYPRATIEWEVIDTMQALLDVARAAENYWNHMPKTNYKDSADFSAALDKLREVGDE